MTEQDKKSETRLEKRLRTCQARITELTKQIQSERSARQQLEQTIQLSSQTQFKVHDALLQTVFDVFLDPVLLVDKDWIIQTLNKAALKYCNVSRQDAIGQNCMAVCCANDDTKSQCAFKQALKTNHTLTRQRPGPTGLNSQELIRIVPLNKKEHGFDGAILFIQDITDKNMIDDQLVLADRLASLSQLSSGIAHEIRNPLAGIMLFVDIMADPKRFQRSTHELDIINEIKTSVQKISEIITRVLDFAKPVTFEKNATDLKNIINETLHLWSQRITTSGIKTSLKLQDNLSQVSGNTIELQQVFSNLILNGIEAMPEGGELTITMQKAQASFLSSQDVVVIQVEDTGQGIDSTHQDFIFNPFFSTKPGNTGLGLSIAYQIVNRHGGTLICSSFGAGANNSGTTFTVELPTAGPKNKETIQ